MNYSLTLSCSCLILLCACAPLTRTSFKKTDEVRGHSRTEVVEIKYGERQRPTLQNPNLVVEVRREVKTQESLQRLYIEKRVLKPGMRLLLWGGGAATAYLGYIVYQDGQIVLGRDLMGLGAVASLGMEVVTNRRTGNDQWRPESRSIASQPELLRSWPIVASVGAASQDLQTGPKGRLVLDISGFTDHVPSGQDMELVLVPAEYPEEHPIFTIPAEIVNAHRECPDPVDCPPLIAKSTRDDMLCVILGIENYRYYSPAPYASRDAIIFEDYARKVFGIPQENIFSKTDENATEGEFDYAFGPGGWLENRIMRGKKEVIVFYSGHGAPVVDSLEAYFVPHDTNPNVDRPGVNRNELYHRLANMGAEHVTFFVDACFSGSGKGGGELIHGTRPPTIEVKQTIAMPNLTIFSATQSKEYAASDPTKQHGLFTYFLLKGLQGEADANRDGEITVDELHDYLQQEVPDKAERQTPELQTLDSDRVLVRYK